MAVKEVSGAQALIEAERLRQAGQLTEAVQRLEQLAASHPDDAQTLHLLGVVQHQLGRTRDAIASVGRAAELAPDEALYQANLGEMWRLAGRLELALEHGERAVALKPDYPEALSNLGIAHYERKDFERAAAMHRRAIAVDEAFAAGHSNLGNALYGLREFEAAAACYRRALALRPDFAEAWGNLGTALHHAGDMDEAVVALRRAIAIDPQSANARSGLGILLLMRSEFAEGWEEYEWRLRSTEVRAPYEPQRPWRDEPLEGRSLYVHAEQGFGDSIQFARYLPLLTERGAKVTFRVQQALAGLMRQSFPGVEVLGDRTAPATGAEFECALLSLPHRFGTRLETIPATTPYLVADAAEARRWRSRLAGDGLAVGIAWAGNPEHVNDQRRSSSLGELAPLFEVGNVRFISLQVGARAADLKDWAGPPILDVAGELVGFASTAAAMSALDLVISVDSAVAHLAGALAKPVWLLTPWLSDWRWLIEREDSPWYPTLRQFRQARGQSWAEVASRLAAELSAVAGGDAARLTPFSAAGERRAQAAAAIIAAAGRPAPRAAAGPSAGQLLAIAAQRRDVGKLAEAATRARRALEVEPDNAEAEHHLGIVAHQAGNLAHAISHLERAIALAPDNPLFHANLGEMQRLAGQFDEAEAQAERALALKPDYPDALSNLGILRYQRGDYDGARALYERAIALRPSFVQAHNNLGNALRALKRLDEAERAYRQALALQPAFAEAWNNLGTTLRELGRLEDSVAAYRQALTLRPDDPEVLNSLALALKELERDDEAEATLRRSLAIEPGNARTLLYLGSVLLAPGAGSEAGALIERAHALAPADPDVLSAMGRLAQERGQEGVALGFFERALAAKPELGDAHANRGNALKALGCLVEAQAAFERAVALNPRSAAAYFNLADGHRFTPDDPLLGAMQSLAAEPALPPTDRLRLDYALFKALSDIGETGRAFVHLARGAGAKRASICYDEAATMALFERIEAVFTPARMAAAPRSSATSDRPVFILGMPRSGTTLVEQILASHPAVVGGGELAWLAEAAGAGYPDSVAGADAAALDAIGA